MYYLVYRSSTINPHLVTYHYCRSALGFTSRNNCALFETIESLLTNSVENIPKDDLISYFVMHSANSSSEIDVHTDTRIGTILDVSRKNKINKL